MAVLRCDTVAAATSAAIALSTSSVTRMACRDTSPRIEYDPNRTARIALVSLCRWREALYPRAVGLQVGQTIMSGAEAEIRVGNALPMRNIPLGSTIHNIELAPGRARSWCAAPGRRAADGQGRQVCPVPRCRAVRYGWCRWSRSATIGQVGNIDHENESIGKAGRSRWMGSRPTVRGSVMNPVDHPHGGGEGRAPIGGQPQTPWGKPRSAIGRDAIRRPIG